jgi:hypothetical protein
MPATQPTGQIPETADPVANYQVYIPETPQFALGCVDELDQVKSRNERDE